MPRAKLKEPEPEPEYDQEHPPCVSSGGHLLDKVLGGGWAQGRISNIIGNRSAGKTGLAIEAMANFAAVSGAENNRYGEAESAFDGGYARRLGMPDGVTIPDDQLDTVEAFHKDLKDWLEEKSADPGLYVLDSLDALSDAAEMERAIGDDATYGAAKAKHLSQMFRRLVRPTEAANAHLMIISQVRDNIGVRFGEKWTRSGGKALDFYASQILFITEVGKERRTVLQEDVVTGIWIEARNRKNKVGMPFRKAKMFIRFNYGIDDELSMVAWLADHKARGYTDAMKGQLTKARTQKDRPALHEINADLRGLVDEHWDRIEEAIMPEMSKYGE